MADLPRLPFPQPDPLRSPPVLATLRRQGPVHRIRTSTGDEAWLVTGHREVRRLLADDRLGRAHPDPDNAARSGQSALFGGPLGNYETEHADSARLRTLLRPLFSPGRMRGLRPRVAALTDELLDGLARSGPPADLHAGLAVPLPVLVICELLGVPYQDRDRFQGWSRDAGDVRDRARSEQGLKSLFGYGMELVARKRREPGDDVISRLCREPGLTDPEVAGLSMALLFAGHETTVVQLGLGALFILTHPDQKQSLLDRPELLHNAVEECLRAPRKGGGGIPRYARTDLEIDHVTIRAGELVLLDTGAANHDPDGFPDPDRFDVSRAAGHHLTFGHGGHYCIGAPLARIELEETFSRLVRRFPTLRLAVPVGSLTVQQDTLTGGVTALPVTW
jgi:pentalenolactone synthase